MKTVPSSEEKKTIRPWNVLLSSALLATILVLAPPQALAQFSGAPTTRAITVELVKDDCPVNLKGGRVVAVEYWWEKSRGLEMTVPRPDELVIRDPSSGEVIVLGQRRQVAEALLDEDGGEFKVTWTELSEGTTVPWLSVFNMSTQERMTVYRFLELSVWPAGGNYYASLDPTPLVSFFGKEQTKNVGPIKVRCSVIDDG